jgi:hypothetical protein
MILPVCPSCVRACCRKGKEDAKNSRQEKKPHRLTRKKRRRMEAEKAMEVCVCVSRCVPT